MAVFQRGIALLRAQTQFSSGRRAVQVLEPANETSGGRDTLCCFLDRVPLVKHALTHEVTYGSLLQDRRCRLHAQIVAATERLYPDRLSEHVERLAHHALGARLWDKAVRYSRQAGTRALDRSALWRAVITDVVPGAVVEGETVAERLPPSSEALVIEPPFVTVLSDGDEPASDFGPCEQPAGQVTLRIQ